MPEQQAVVVRLPVHRPPGTFHFGYALVLAVWGAHVDI
jgi:hypothetical protein